MKWTKQLSQRAVAARARRRIQRVSELSAAEDSQVISREVLPRTMKPDFIITIRCRDGRRLRITATRWGRRIITGDSITTPRAIGLGIAALLKHAHLATDH